MDLPKDLIQKFGSRAQKVLNRLLSKREKVDIIDLLREIYLCKGSLGSNFLRRHGFREDDLRQLSFRGNSMSRSHNILESKKQTGGYFSKRLKSSIKKAVLSAVRLRQKFIGTHHLLYGFFEEAEKDPIFSEFFKSISKPIPQLIDSLKEVLITGGQIPRLDKIDVVGISLSDLNNLAEGGLLQKPALYKENAQSSGGREDSLFKEFGVDLTEKAEKGELDPLIGREKELERLIQVLTRRTKRNPVLIGEAGVGKTAIVQGLAQRIAEGEVPETLLGKRIYSIRISSIVAGTMFRGDFEARLEALLGKIKRSGAIVFIDEIHNIIGAGSAQGSLDVANIIKPPLANGEIQVIGATTLREYRKYIESDQALERRFQPIVVQEPDKETTVKILQGLKKLYEDFHNIKIEESTLRETVDLAQRYIQERFLPDKAIDLLDEAASRKKNEFAKIPQMKKMLELKKHLQETVKRKDQAVAREDFEQAFRLKEEERRILEEINFLEDKINRRKSGRLAVVKAEDIRWVVSEITGVPLKKIEASEARALVGLESKLQREIIGQEEAIAKIVSTVKRSRAGLVPSKRPLGSFIFMGPTGVGKTELSKVLARMVFGEKALIKLDVSEFSQPHTVARLTGAPAGYVGYKEGGQLVEKVQHQPYSVILFDEIEKAHPQIHNILLQILEDGSLTDATGKTVDFSNTIVILTTNIGTEEFTREAEELGFRTTKGPSSQGQESYETVKRDSLEKLKFFFKPELINRIDEIIVFNPLGREQIYKIVRKELRCLKLKLLKKRNINLEISSGVVAFLAKESFVPREGARLVRKKIQDILENYLAEQIIQRNILAGQKVHLKMRRGKLIHELR